MGNNETWIIFKVTFTPWNTNCFFIAKTLFKTALTHNIAYKIFKRASNTPKQGGVNPSAAPNSDISDTSIG